MKKKWSTYFIAFLYIACIFGTIPVYGEASKDQTDDPVMGFNYKTNLPENQINKGVGYFDLRMTPNQKQTVQVELTNDSEKEINVAISINGAKTNGNGVIEYGPSSIENDKSLKHKFTDIVKGPDKVTIPAKKTVPLELEINMPGESFDGVISGGIQMKQLPEDEEADKKKTGVINEYAFLVGMVLNETDTKVEPDLKLNKVYAGLTNYRNAVYINLSNDQAEYLEDLTMDVQIMKKDTDEVIYDTKKASMRMAPNSLIDFPVSMNGEEMVAGEYRAHILATSGERKWEWTEAFTITDDEADDFNGKDVTLTQESGVDWKIIGLIVGGVIVLLGGIFFIVRMINRKNVKKKKSVKKKKTIKSK